MLTALSLYGNATRILGSAGAPGVVDMTTVDADNAQKQIIVDQVFPPSQRSGSAGFNAGALSVLWDAMNNGYVRQYYAADEVASDCSAASPSATQQIQATATAIGEQALNLGLKAAAVVPVVGQILDAAINIFSAITQHHALAVQQEQTTLCLIVPKINDAIAGLDQAITQGQITLQQAFDGLSYLQNTYLQTVQPILKNSSSACNAACVIDRGIVALLEYKSYKYSKFVAAVAANPSINVPVAIENSFPVAAAVQSTTVAAVGNALGTSPNETLVLIIGVILIIILLVRR